MNQIPTQDYSWIVEHPEIEEQYVGEWIAIQDKKVIAHSRNLQEVLHETSSLEPPPHITFVEEEGLAAYALYLLL
jgi:hypothetical protein